MTLATNGITYGSGPHAEVWFPITAKLRPALGDAKIRYATERDGNLVYSNDVLVNFIPDTVLEKPYWIGVPVKDQPSLNLLQEFTGFTLDTQRILRMRSLAAVEKNAQTPNPSRPDEPDTFFEEVNKLTAMTDLAARAKRDYAEREEGLKDFVRCAAKVGSRAVGIIIYDLPTDDRYREAFADAMRAGAFSQFDVGQSFSDDDDPGLALEITW